MTNQKEFSPGNESREIALVTHFKKHIGKRVFILTEAFPFMYIGNINGVIRDLVVIDVQTTSVPALEGKKWNLHIDSIDIFYIEEESGPKIPYLQDGWNEHDK